MKIILASASPRRKEILSRENFEFTVIKSNYEETSFNADALTTAKTFALNKAKDVFNKISIKSDEVVLGADTVVFFDGEILGKPKDSTDAKRMLKKLSDKTHSVITGYALISKDKCVCDATKSQVTFNQLSDELIERYVASKLPLDKAGGYGIQDGYDLVKGYSGSLDNIIGLPIEDIKEKLKEF